MFTTADRITDFDPELWAALEGETRRQEEHIELIASENYTSPRVLAAQGSVLTINTPRATRASAIMAAASTWTWPSAWRSSGPRRCLEPTTPTYNRTRARRPTPRRIWRWSSRGDIVLGMSLAHGGHLTHGAKVNFSGRLYHAVQYGLDETSGEIDYDQVEALAHEFSPKLIVAGFSAYSRVLDFARFRAIADAVGAYLLVDMAHVAGLVAAGLYPNPVPFADVVTSTTHKTLRGPRGGLILARANTAIEKKLNALVFPGTQGGPLMHVIAAKAVAFKEALQPNSKPIRCRCWPMRGRWWKCLSSAATRSSPTAPMITCFCWT